MSIETGTLLAIGFLSAVTIWVGYISVISKREEQREDVQTH